MAFPCSTQTSIVLLIGRAPRTSKNSSLILKISRARYFCAESTNILFLGAKCETARGQDFVGNLSRLRCIGDEDSSSPLRYANSEFTASPPSTSPCAQGHVGAFFGFFGRRFGLEILRETSQLSSTLVFPKRRQLKVTPESERILFSS